MIETWADLNGECAALERRLARLRVFLDVDRRLRRIGELEAVMSDPKFWNSQDRAQRIIKEVNDLRHPLAPLDALESDLRDLRAYVELLADTLAPESSVDFSEVVHLCEDLQRRMDDIELQSFLRGPHDNSNAIVTIHSGAGGTEACDWAEMVLRMYTRWAALREFQCEIQDIQSGDEAGISRATFRLIGTNAYGYCKAERGVHRLVRISPFDANKRRHTSFCSVDVIAEIEDDGEIEIRDEDLRVDTYRSSGKGGQHVNKTESAVRITHLPSGIVVTCQNDRSQQKNRLAAIRVLRARIYEQRQDEKRSALEKFYGAKGEIGWGYQIRSYVFQPYQMVKDLRTGVETSNIQAVMDGDLDLFINGWLRAGCPSTRQSLAKDVE
ncbi:MAG: peptide chain release factor 2 [Puniceicoccales bacterium]|nr:peptide chain release factor 2 [Puniceicoccales bacterium]